MTTTARATVATATTASPATTAAGPITVTDSAPDGYLRPFNEGRYYGYRRVQDDY